MLTAWSNRMQVLNPWKLFLLYLSLPTPPLQGWVDSSGLSSRECPKFLLTMFGPGQGHHIFLIKSRCPYFRLPWLCHLSKHHSTLSFCWRTSHRRSIKKWGCCIITKLKLEYWNWNVIWLSGVIKYDPSWDFFFSRLQMTKLLEVHLLLKNRNRTGLKWRVSVLWRLVRGMYVWSMKGKVLLGESLCLFLFSHDGCCHLCWQMEQSGLWQRRMRLTVRRII